MIVTIIKLQMCHLKEVDLYFWKQVLYILYRMF